MAYQFKIGYMIEQRHLERLAEVYESMNEELNDDEVTRVINVALSEYIDSLEYTINDLRDDEQDDVDFDGDDYDYNKSTPCDDYDECPYNAQYGRDCRAYCGIQI